MKIPAVPDGQLLIWVAAAAEQALGRSLKVMHMVQLVCIMQNAQDFALLQKRAPELTFLSLLLYCFQAAPDGVDRAVYESFLQLLVDRASLLSRHLVDLTALAAAVWPGVNIHRARDKVRGAGVRLGIYLPQGCYKLYGFV